jgi:hypothetical protein
MPRPGSISNKARATLNSKLAVLRGTRPQKSKMAAFGGRSKDEGSTAKAEIPGNEINNKTNQSKKGAVGSVSKGGGIGKAESQFTNNELNAGRNKKTWPNGGGVSASNPATGNTRMKGKIPAQGGQYGGGGRNTQ